MQITRSTFLKSGLIKSAALGLCAVGLLTACGGDNTDNSVWSVGTEPGFPPFESMNAEGEIEGFDIDLMTAIGEKSGKTIEFQNLPFDSLISALQGGTIDAAISGMSIKPERAEVVDFSDPYFSAGLAIAVMESNTDINELADLQGKRIAAQIGTTGASTAESVADATVTTFDNAPLALQELANGNVDAVINDAPATEEAIESGSIPGIKIVGEVLTAESYGIALPKGSENLAAVNAGLAAIKADGTYAELYRKWFEEEPPTQ